jgi:hypothetical protein
MTTTTDMIQPTQRKNFILAKLWIFIIILLVLVLLTGSRVILASSSYTSVHGNMLVEPGLSSTATAKATSTSEPTTTNPKPRNHTLFNPTHNDQPSLQRFGYPVTLSIYAQALVPTFQQSASSLMTNSCCCWDG